MKTSIVLISGKQGSGKTSIANALQRQIHNAGQKSFVELLNFADPIRAMHNFCQGMLKQAGLVAENAPIDGTLMQLLGTEWGRRCIADNVWVNYLKAELERRQNTRKNMFEHLIFVIADVRFENELFAFPDALRVRLECPEDERQVRAEKWRPNTVHPSEVSLDTLAALGVFDLYLDTSSIGTSIEGCVNLIHAQILKGNWKEKRP